MKLVVIFLFLLPMAYALSCNEVFSDKMETCNEIMNSSLENKEAQYLIANLIYTDNQIANHSIISDWNSKIKFNATSPENAVTQSQGYIQNAWLKIITIMPSVNSDNKILTPETGRIISAYNYSISIPSDIEEGDCQTNYALESREESLNVYQNGRLIGTSTLIDFEGSGELNFSDLLRIRIVTKIDHYKPHSECCCYSRRGCCGYCEECRYENTEYITHEVNLEDTLTAYQYWPAIMPKIRAVDRYRNTTVIMLNISDFASLSVEFSNSSFRQFNYNYIANVSMNPYDVLTLSANKFPRRIVDNLYFEQFNNTYKFYVSEPSGCKLTFRSHFHTWKQDCNLEFDFPEFGIKTDKLAYSENETIRIDLTPSDKIIEISYGNNTITAENHAEFSAKKGHNRIIARFDERNAEKVIHVKNTDSWDIMLNLGVFSGVLYSVYFLIRRYFPWM